METRIPTSAETLAALDRVENALRDGIDCVEAYHGNSYTNIEENQCSVCIWTDRANAVLGDRKSPA
jgi:hypothetical protein